MPSARPRWRFIGPSVVTFSLCHVCPSVSPQSKLEEALTRLNVSMRVLLTGTPIQNHLKELFALLRFLDPQKFPDEEEFLAKNSALHDDAVVRDGASPRVGGMSLVAAMMTSFPLIVLSCDVSSASSFKPTCGLTCCAA
jgi:hypothetical protein